MHKHGNVPSIHVSPAGNGLILEGPCGLGLRARVGGESGPVAGLEPEAAGLAVGPEVHDLVGRGVVGGARGEGAPVVAGGAVPGTLLPPEGKRGVGRNREGTKKSEKG